MRRAQKNEDDTTLRAPVAGTVASVNGIVGQQSGSGSRRRVVVELDRRRLRRRSSSSSTSSSSSSGFIELTDVDLLDVKVGFTETDAPKVKVGQAATITLDALPNETFTGHVIALDTNSTLVSNVVTYYAKVAFDGTPADVKPGMTASVNVVLDKRDDVDHAADLGGVDDRHQPDRHREAEGRHRDARDRSRSGCAATTRSRSRAASASATRS